MAPQSEFSLRGCCRLRGHSHYHREHDLLEHVQREAKEGDADSVLRSIEEYTHHTRLKRKLRKEKYSILDAAVQKRNPTWALEIGTYCGYSAIRIASHMKPGAVLFSIEMDSVTYNIATEMIKHAGMSSKVIVLKGTLTQAISEIVKKGYYDFIFMNQPKKCYLKDLLKLKEAEVLYEGSWIVADCHARIIADCQARNYMNYLRDHPDEFENKDMKDTTRLPYTMTVCIYKEVDVRSSVPILD